MNRFARRFIVNATAAALICVMGAVAAQAELGPGANQEAAPAAPGRPGGRGQPAAPAPQAAPQPQAAPAQPQRAGRQPGQDDRGDFRGRGGGPGFGGGGPGFDGGQRYGGGGYSGGGYEDRGYDRGYRRPGYAYEEEPVYQRRRRDFGRACATSRGVCYVGRPQPIGTGCRCDLPGFGLKRGNIEG